MNFYQITFVFHHQRSA